jgi:spore coat polysaccharide biosynthesis protein SpsF
MIDWVVDRARQMSETDKTVVATSTLDREEPLVEHLEERGVSVIRGPEQDVLARYVQAAEANDADAVVRITADCPLLMPTVSDRVVRAFRESGCDYASNTIERTFPRGLDTEVLSVEALRRVDDETSDPADREHVTRYVRQHPEEFGLRSVTATTDRSSLRWTVDEEADLQFVRQVYRELGERGEEATYDEALELLKAHPEWAGINQQVGQKPW